jgi:enediyne biosynthesis protein E4
MNRGPAYHTPLLVITAVVWVVRAIDAPPPVAVDFSFTENAKAAGLNQFTVYGGTRTNRYLLETTGCGVAVLDVDGDGWLDIFLVNGTTLEGFPSAKAPMCHLYRNRRDGTFEDVTTRAGVGQGGWGQGACAADYDNDGRDDLFVTSWGQNRLYRNRGDGTFDDVTARAGLMNAKRRWGAGCAFIDYDRDGKLDLFAANYIDFDLANAPVPESGLCRYKGVPVACGPPGLPGGKNVLYHNKGDGTFEDVSVKSRITTAAGTLYRNNQDGTFTDIAVVAGCAYSQDGKPQAGMGVAIGDYDHNGTMDIFKTNFAGDTSTLYANTGKGLCDDRTFQSGLGRNTRWLGWGVAFSDLDLDGWLDLFLVNGHVYPEVEQLKTEFGYRQRKVVYRNLGDNRFEDVTDLLGPPVTTAKAGRGAAFADIDNDGHIDIIVNNVNDTPDLFRSKAPEGRSWLMVKLVGRTSNRSAIGARVRAVVDDRVQV